MKKALVSFANGDPAKTLEVALPTFEAYARRHGYDLLTDLPDFYGRPASWAKVPLLKRLLKKYDFAFWIDADAIIVDGSVDVETVIPKTAFQALVFMPIGYRGEAGVSPCCGVWALRAGDRTQRFLSEIWKQEDLAEHQWWEQAAVMRFLGWRLDGFPVVKERFTAWDKGTFALPGEWDVIPKYAGLAPRDRIRHYAAESHERRMIEMGTDLAQVQGDWLRYGLGWLERHSRRFPRLTDKLDELLMRPSRSAQQALGISLARRVA
jgi:hypothetical protein